MYQKNVPPRDKGFLKRLLTGVLGGIIGALLTAGILYAVGGSRANLGNTGDNGTASGSNTAAKVSDVTINTNSDITKAVEKVQGAVVSVINLQRESSQSDLGNWADIFGGRQAQQESSDEGDLQEAGEGSGVIYKIEGNTAYIVTNNHVVEGQQGLDVLLDDGGRVKAELIGTDAYTDLAVLKIESDKIKDVKAANFGDSSKLKVGEPAIAIGSPLGSQYANSVTSGIISSLNREVVNQNEEGQTVNINAIQTDAAINPGNSGGPLVNIEGQVVGINSSKIVQTQSNVNVEGIGFAIPSNDVVDIINKIEKDGKVIRPALGIRMVNLSDISSEQVGELKVPESVTNGVVVASVINNGPAEKAGLKQLDVITEIDGKEISSGVELQSELYKHAVGDDVSLTYYRDGKKETAKINLSMEQSDMQSNNNQQQQQN